MSYLQFCNIQVELKNYYKQAKKESTKETMENKIHDLMGVFAVLLEEERK